MPRFLTDEDFDGRLTGALLARVPGLDIVRAQDTGLMHTPDPAILAWAAGEGPIVLTHGRNTMTGFASTRVNAGQRGKNRPAVVVQPDAYASAVGSVVVAEVTKNLTVKSDPVSPFIAVGTPEGKTTGLFVDSVVSRCFSAIPAIMLRNGTSCLDNRSDHHAKSYFCR
jgi:hypothetical protein